MSEPIHIISLGAGVQSSTMALMAAKGEITPMPEAAIFADTQCEPAAVYEWLGWLVPKLPFPVIKVTKGNLWEATKQIRISRKNGKQYWKNWLPTYSINPDGSKGMFPRKCTHDFKLVPLLQEQRRIVGKVSLWDWRKKHKNALKQLSDYENGLREYRRNKKAGIAVGDAPMRPQAAWDECQNDVLAFSWIGISLDEASRIKESKLPFVKNIFPLVENVMTRKNCLWWMRRNKFPQPPKSACVFCPYHSNQVWQKMKTEQPNEFARAVQVEIECNELSTKANRIASHEFLHPSRIPLDQVDFGNQPDKDRDSFENECEGMCGV